MWGGTGPIFKKQVVQNRGIGLKVLRLPLLCRGEPLLNAMPPVCTLFCPMRHVEELGHGPNSCVHSLYF